MEKPNKIIKANGGKKKTSRSKRKKGWVYYRDYEGSRGERGWTNDGEPNCEGWYEWREEGYTYARTIERFRKVFNFTEGIERGEKKKEPDVQIFKTRFFKERFSLYAKYLLEQHTIINHAKKIGLWNDKVAQNIGDLMPMVTLEKLQNTKDEIQAFLCFRVFLKQVSFIANAARHIVIRFTEHELVDWNDGFDGTSYIDYGIDTYDFYNPEAPICEKAQDCLDWFVENNEFLEWIHSDINWLIDEMGMVCGELTKYPMHYWKKWSSKEEQIAEFYECIDEDCTFGLEYNYNEAGLRLWSWALMAVLDPDTTIPIKFSSARFSKPRYLVKDLVNKDFPKARGLLAKIDIVKYRKWLEEIKGDLDGVTLDRHKTNFNHYDNLAEKLDWAEDQIFAIGISEDMLESSDHETNERFLGEFIESLEQVEKWGSDEEAGDLAQIQRYYFEKKTAPKGTVKTATVNVKLFANDDDPLLERLSDAIENVSPEYGGCKMGDITIVWEGSAVLRDRKDKDKNVIRKLSAPLADNLREHIARFADDIPHGSFNEDSQYGFKNALSPAWQKIFDVFPIDSSKERKAWLIDRTSVDEKGKIIDGSEPTPIKIREYQGRTKHTAYCLEIAQYLIDHCDPKELERRLNNHLNLVKSKQKKSAS